MKEQHYTASPELLDALAEAYLRAEILASRSPELEALAGETCRYRGLLDATGGAQQQAGEMTVSVMPGSTDPQGVAPAYKNRQAGVCKTVALSLAPHSGSAS
jgi:hypothetical protein